MENENVREQNAIVEECKKYACVQQSKCVWTGPKRELSSFVVSEILSPRHRGERPRGREQGIRRERTGGPRGRGWERAEGSKGRVLGRPEYVCSGKESTALTSHFSQASRVQYSIQNTQCNTVCSFSPHSLHFLLLAVPLTTRGKLNNPFRVFFLSLSTFFFLASFTGPSPPYRTIPKLTPQCQVRLHITCVWTQQRQAHSVYRLQTARHTRTYLR